MCQLVIPENHDSLTNSQPHRAGDWTEQEIDGILARWHPDNLVYVRTNLRLPTRHPAGWIGGRRVYLKFNLDWSDPTDGICR